MQLNIPIQSSGCRAGSKLSKMIVLPLSKVLQSLCSRELQSLPCLEDHRASFVPPISRFMTLPLAKRISMSSPHSRH